jgi:hypothetical protein
MHMSDRQVAEIMLAYAITSQERIDMTNRILAEAGYAPHMLDAREAHARAEAYWRGVLAKETVQ